MYKDSKDAINLSLQNRITKDAVIDSYGVFVRESDCAYVDHKITTIPALLYDDEVIEDIQTLQPQTFKRHGITLRFNRVHIQSATHKGKEVFKGGYFLRFVVTAKMLGADYFEGLNLQNLDKVLHFINASGLIFVSKEVFLQSIFNDLDICKNFYMPNPKYELYCHHLKGLVKPSLAHAVSYFKEKPKNENGVKIYSDNKGVIYGESRANGKFKNPFIKFYNKASELYTKSLQFYNVYLSSKVRHWELSLENLKRWEISVKNSDHKRQIVKKGLTVLPELKTVKDMYTLSTKELSDIMDFYLKQYYKKKRTQAYKLPKDFSPNDKVTYWLIERLLHRGASEKEIMGALDLFEGTQKTRVKKRLDRLIAHAMNTDYLQELIEENNDFETFLEYLNLKNHIYEPKN